jgi:hypothetical protein
MGVMRIESCVLRIAPACVTHWLLMFYEKRRGNFPRSFTKQSLKIWRKGPRSIFLIFSQILTADDADFADFTLIFFNIYVEKNQR